MATFYGQVFGNGRTSATRGGTYASGLRTTEQSYQGSVIVELTQPEDDDVNVVVHGAFDDMVAAEEYAIELQRADRDRFYAALKVRPLERATY